MVAKAEFHPLIEAVHRAFAEHRSLILSPDAIWLTITQGFGHHVVENAEALRSKLVGFDGKRELAVAVQSFPTDEEWPGVIELWSASIREYVPPKLHAALQCSFSTTTPAIRTASEVAIMDAFQKYFDYVLVCICGIPEVTLRGTVEDWRSIRQRVEQLTGYEIDHWIARLRPILDEFVKSAAGNPDKDFWQSIYKPASAYGGEVATGWITDLFPYLESSGQRYPNNTLKVPRDGWALPQNGSSYNGYGIAPADFPSGLSCAPFTVRYETEPPLPEQKRNLLAGFLGVVQTTEGRLAPHIGWAVTEGDPIDKLWDTLAARFPTKPATDCPERHEYLLENPAELVGFYKRFDELVLFPDTPRSWRIGLAPFRCQAAVFAQGPDDWLLIFRFTGYTNGRWSHTVATGKLPVELRGKGPAAISEVSPELVEVRELEGTILEVLQRLVDAEGDIEQVE